MACDIPVTAIAGSRLANRPPSKSALPHSKDENSARKMAMCRRLPPRLPPLARSCPYIEVVDAKGFGKVVDVLRAFTPRAEILLEEVPAPQKLAAFSYALSADVSNGLVGDAEDEIASGRFVLLHEPGGQETWEGEFRCVTYVRADVDVAMQEDPLLPEVGWNWLLESLSLAGCKYVAASGTVTRVASASFGKLSPRSDEAEIEIRASWTPLVSSPDDIRTHITGWSTLLAELSGLQPVPEGVTAINPQANINNRGRR